MDFGLVLKTLPQGGSFIGLYKQIADHILEDELDGVNTGGTKAIWKVMKLMQATDDDDLM